MWDGMRRELPHDATMAISREPDALMTHMILEHARVLEGVERFVAGARPSALDSARQIIEAFADAEEAILFPMVAKLRPQTRDVLADAVGDRAQQLAELEALVRSRSRSARKLAAATFADRIRGDLERRLAQILPALASQLPRVQYRAVIQAFLRRYEAAGQRTEKQPRRVA
jgi:hypothetical protein